MIGEYTAGHRAAEKWLDGMVRDVDQPEDAEAYRAAMRGSLAYAMAALNGEVAELVRQIIASLPPAIRERLR